jgi:short-subunit dehydrogenase involved in D-alanine esterification of teichoic acids
LTTLQRKYPGKIFPVTHVAEDGKSTEEVAKIVKEKFGYVDVVIGNAGKYMNTYIQRSLRFSYTGAVQIILLSEDVNANLSLSAIGYHSKLRDSSLTRGAEVFNV